MRSTLIFAFMLMLAACGGGGETGNTANMSMKPSQDDMVEGGSDPEAQPPYMPPITVETLTSELSRAEVQSYLARVEADDDAVVFRWAEAPQVRMAVGTSERYRRAVERSVHAINAALPWKLHLTIGPDMQRPPGSGLQDIGNGVLPPSTIFVDHSMTVDQVNEEWMKENPGEDGAWGWAKIHLDGWDEETETWINPTPQSSWVVVGRIEGEYGYFEQVVAERIIHHELLHALGFAGHLYEPNDPLSYLNHPERLDAEPSTWEPDLPVADKEALYALYRFRDEASWGAWDRGTLRITGGLKDPIQTRRRVPANQRFRGVTATRNTAFGVDYRNGLAMPWLVGFSSGNPLPQGATWNGEIVGFEPDADAVHGSARITVDMSAIVKGTASFDEMVYVKDGSVWGDGNLAYGLAFDRSYFRAVSGDTGDLHGRVVGNKQEGAIGTLEREDLTAAFGGSR